MNINIMWVKMVLLMKTSASSLSMEARVLAIKSESRLSTSLGDLVIIMGMMMEIVSVEMRMMTIGSIVGLITTMVTMDILMMTAVILIIRIPGYCGTILS